MENIGVIVQARTGSTRLPQKVLKEIKGIPVLKHVYDRVNQSKYLYKTIIATTTNNSDNKIEDLCKRYGIDYYRGSENNVLERYYYCAKKYKLDIIIRITSDCPLIDPHVIDKMIEEYQKSDYNMVTNAGADKSLRTFPRGLDVEIFSFELLEKAFNNANKDYQKEHVTPYMYEVSDKILYYKNEKNYSSIRITLDTEEDFTLINQIYGYLYRGEHNFYLEDIINLFNQYPEIGMINQHIKQKTI